MASDSQPEVSGSVQEGEVPHLPGLSVASDANARPFIKWAGGKTRLLEVILHHAPRKFKNYHEPFLGGGAVFFKARKRASGASYLADLNEELVNTWLVVKNRPEELLQELRDYDGLDTEEDYYEVRAASPDGEVERAARFLYLNKTSWNGLWRVNRKGQYNVPWGQRPFPGIAPDLIAAVSAALQDATIEVADFRETLGRAEAGDFVYMDPPYLPLSPTSKFRFYTRKRFVPQDLAELAEECHKLEERGVAWVLSNRGTNRVRDLFSEFKVVPLTVKRSVAAQNKRDVEKVESPEALIVGGHTL